jgi:hypothetical protein
MEHIPVELLLAMASGAAGYIARLFTSEGKMRREMSFIKGQLEQLIGMIRSIEDVRVKQAVLEKDLDKARHDINHAHQKIRDIHEDLTATYED